MKDEITKSLLLCAVTGLVLMTACGTPPQKPDKLKNGDYSYTRQYISWLIKEKMAELDIVGLSISLVDDQRLVWAEGFGWAGFWMIVWAKELAPLRVMTAVLFCSTAA
jgi:hypothetical protein